MDTGRLGVELLDMSWLGVELLVTSYSELAMRGGATGHELAMRGGAIGHELVRLELCNVTSGPVAN